MMEAIKTKPKRKKYTRKVAGQKPEKSIKNNCGGKRRKKGCAYDVLLMPYCLN